VERGDPVRQKSQVKMKDARVLVFVTQHWPYWRAAHGHPSLELLHLLRDPYLLLLCPHSHSHRPEFVLQLMLSQGWRTHTYPYL